jgi:hypothetical protein
VITTLISPRRNTCDSSSLIDVYARARITPITGEVLQVFREGSKEGAHNSKTLKLLTFGAEKLKKWMTLSNQYAML